MKHYKAYNIDWDTDGEDVILPSKVFFDVEDDWTNEDVSLEGANIISDKYGWCINSFSFEEVKGHRDKFGRIWNLPKCELCSVCGQPDSCGDCNHRKLKKKEAILLGGKQ